MDNPAIVIAPLEADSPALQTCAGWRHEAFLKDYGYSLDDSRNQLLTITGGNTDEIALVAHLDGQPVGICLLVHDELDSPHDHSPWLASLFVVAEQRGRGIGRALVVAIEDHARGHGHQRIHLYTDEAEPFYLKCGWRVAERFDWQGFSTALMIHDL